MTACPMPDDVCADCGYRCTESSVEERDAWKHAARIAGVPLSVWAHETLTAGAKVDLEAALALLDNAGFGPTPPNSTTDTTDLQILYYRLHSRLPFACPPGVTEADIRRAAELFGVDVDADFT